MAPIGYTGYDLTVRQLGVRMQWNVGNVVVTKVVEIEQPIPLVGMLPDATPEALAAHVSWLQPHFIDAEGMTRLSIHSLVIESQGVRILVDTCVGDRDIPGMAGFRGPSDFPDRLAAAGSAVDTIDIVCCTHLHFDHVGWNTRLEGDRWVPTFPNARYLFARREYEHWTAAPGGSALNLPDTVEPLVVAGRADLVDDGHRLTSEVRLVPTPGHSPGHVSVLIESEGERALITGDATHHPVQWAEIDWTMIADSDSAQAAVTRGALIAEHGGTGTLVIGTHYATPTAGRIVADGDGWRFET